MSEARIDEMFEQMAISRDVGTLKDIPDEFISRGNHPQISFVIDSNNTKISYVLDIIRKVQSSPQSVKIDGKKSRFEFETLIRSNQKLDTRTIQNCFISETDLVEPRGVIILKLKSNFEDNVDDINMEAYGWFVSKQISNFINDKYKQSENFIFEISTKV